jgi:hypothetical protein
MNDALKNRKLVWFCMTRKDKPPIILSSEPCYVSSKFSLKKTINKVLFDFLENLEGDTKGNWVFKVMNGAEVLKKIKIIILTAQS